MYHFPIVERDQAIFRTILVELCQIFRITSENVRKNVYTYTHVNETLP